MLRKLSTIMAAAYLLLTLSACNGRSGSSGVLPTGDDADDPRTKTVKVKVTLAYSHALAKAAAGLLVVDPTEEAYQSAVVTLTVPDGRVFTMTYSGDGEYSCIVSKLPDGVSGYIEAKINDMVLKSFFDGLFARQSVIDAGKVGADSTFAADVLTSFAKTLSGSALDPIHIITGVTDASLSIDIQSLNAISTDGSTVEYELARLVYGNVLSWDNINLTGVQIDGLISGDESVINLRDQIGTGMLVAPAAGGPVEEAKLFAADFVDAYFNTRTSAALLPYLSPTTFLWSGLDTTGFVARSNAEWAGDPLFTGSVSADFTNATYSVSPTADFTGTGLDMYVVSLEGTFDLTLTNGTVVTRSFGSKIKRFYASKVGGLWLCFGDRKQMAFDYQIGYFNSNDPGRFTDIVVTAGAGSEVPVSVTVSLGVNTPETVYAPATAPSKFSFKLSGGPARNWLYESDVASRLTSLAYASLNGVVMTLTATFADTSTTTFRKVIQVQSPTTVITSFVQNSNGSITLAWVPPGVDERLLRVEVAMPKNGLRYSLTPNTNTFTIPAADLTAAGVLAYFNNNLDVIYFTPTAQYSYRQFFSWVGTP